MLTAYVVSKESEGRIWFGWFIVKEITEGVTMVYNLTNGIFYATVEHAVDAAQSLAQDMGYEIDKLMIEKDSHLMIKQVRGPSVMSVRFAPGNLERNRNAENND